MGFKSNIFCLVFTFSTTVFAGIWERVSPDTIKFSGTIEVGEFNKFSEVFQSSDKFLIVNSDGGRMDEGLKIGLVMINHNIDVIVRGTCASSCANYLFIAGKRKIIEEGFVGFHGNWKAMYDSPEHKDRILHPSPENKLKAEALIKLSEEMIPQETEFFAKAGVSQDLFIKTQNENDAGYYDLYLPGAWSFSRYGIKNVEGNQNCNMAQARGLKILAELY